MCVNAWFFSHRQSPTIVRFYQLKTCQCFYRRSVVRECILHTRQRFRIPLNYIKDWSMTSHFWYGNIMVFSERECFDASIENCGKNQSLDFFNVDSYWISQCEWANTPMYNYVDAVQCWAMCVCGHRSMMVSVHIFYLPLPYSLRFHLAFMCTSCLEDVSKTELWYAFLRRFLFMHLMYCNEESTWLLRGRTYSIMFTSWGGHADVRAGDSHWCCSNIRGRPRLVPVRDCLLLKHMVCWKIQQSLTIITHHQYFLYSFPMKPPFIGDFPLPNLMKVIPPWLSDRMTSCNCSATGQAISSS